MKKLLTILLACMMLMPLVSAFSMPNPVYGRFTIDGNVQPYLDVTLINLRTGEIETTETNSLGEFMIELANMQGGYSYGDAVSVRFCYGANYCEHKFNVDGPKQIIVDAHDNEVMFWMKGVVVSVGDFMIASQYWWYAGFVGLVSYWFGKGKKARATKMLQTFWKKVKARLYK